MNLEKQIWKNIANTCNLQSEAHVKATSKWWGQNKIAKFTKYSNKQHVGPNRVTRLVG